MEVLNLLQASLLDLLYELRDEDIRSAAQVRWLDPAGTSSRAFLGRSWRPRRRRSSGGRTPVEPPGSDRRQLTIPQQR